MRQVQQELDTVVEEGVTHLVKLLKNSESPVSRRWGGEWVILYPLLQDGHAG